MGVAYESLISANDVASGKRSSDDFFVDTLGINESARENLSDFIKHGDSAIDPVVAYMIGATNGMAYQHLVGKLKEYPFPEIRLPASNGELLIDIGCNWGRWCIAAALKGYSAIGIDPSLGAILAARRVSEKLELNVKYVVADARYMPFRNSAVDVVYSYSVIQHFSSENARKAIFEIGRVLKSGGKSLVQMPTKFGIRCMYHQIRRKFREPVNFEVRYWTLPNLKRIFQNSVGETKFSVDCFFGIGLQASDLRLMPTAIRMAIRMSEALRKLSLNLYPLVFLADSVFVSSKKPN